jgi:hypothetical protein
MRRRRTGAKLVYAVDGYAFFDSLTVDPEGYNCIATARKDFDVDVVVIG